jgi:hypothetical protein
MANREVNLTKRVETPQGWRYCRVVPSANGRVKPDVVVVSEKEEKHPEGAYYLEWREGREACELVCRQGCGRGECKALEEGSRTQCGE